MGGSFRVVGVFSGWWEFFPGGGRFSPGVVGGSPGVVGGSPGVVGGFSADRCKRVPVVRGVFSFFLYVLCNKIDFFIFFNFFSND